MKIILFLMFIGLTNISFAQLKSTEDNIKMRLFNIQQRDSLINSIKKDEILIDTLKAQIIDYISVQNNLFDILQSKNDTIYSLKAELSLIKLVLSDSTDVYQSSTLQYTDYPQCLQPKMKIVNGVIEANNLLLKIEKEVDSLLIRYADLDDIDKNKYISRAILPDKDKLYDLLKTILDSDLSILSDMQKEYIKPGLTERYNNLKKYFE